MSRGINTVAIFLHAPVTNDARVLKTMHSLSSCGWVCDLFCEEGSEDDVSLLPAGSGFYPVLKHGRLLGKLLNRTWFTRAHMALYKSARKVRGAYEMVWANDLPCLSPAYRLARDSGAFLVYDSHEIYLETINQFFPSRSKGIKRLFHRVNIRCMRVAGERDERRYGKEADVVITVNDALKRHFEEKYGWPNVEVLRNTPKLKEILPLDLRKKYAIPESAKIVLYQGGLNAGRGLGLLLASIQHLPADYFLLILGDGYIRPDLEKQAIDSGLSSRMVFGGVVSQAELPAHTAGADVGVNLLEPFNLSKALASPNKLYEYVHAGIPVLCSEAVESSSFLNQYNVGVTTALHPEAIAESIVYLTEKFELDAAEVERCRSELNWDLNFEAVYQRIFAE